MDEFDAKKIKLIVGLGNIGAKYQFTRHNAGFLFLDLLASKFNLQFKEEKKFFCFFTILKAENTIGDEQKTFLIKPTTMMNESGKSVRLTSKFFQIKPDEILVVHDDLDIELGRTLLQLGKGPKVHNGILSIQNFLGNSRFWRLRIGVDSRSSEERKMISGSDYVLKKMSSEELFQIEQAGQEFISKYFTS